MPAEATRATQVHKYSRINHHDTIMPRHQKIKKDFDGRRLSFGL
jgi:hypothetical protein